MSTPPENPSAGSTPVVKTASNAVARRGARAIQELALHTREGEWLLTINLALTPAGTFSGSPRDGEEKDAPNDGEEKDAPADGEEKDAPSDGEEKDPPNEGGSTPIAHAPIELRGATISVRFGTHAACKVVAPHVATARRGAGPGSRRGKRDQGKT